MMTRTITVSAVQPAAHDRDDFSATWPRVLGRVREAAASGADLIVLPEATVPGYVLGHEPLDPAALEAASREVAAISARFGCVVVYGAAVPTSDGTVRNVAVVEGPNGRLGASAKRFLWHFDRHWFTPGDDARAIETPFGKIGILVCADGRLPTLARALVDDGAELLVVPTAWVTSGRDPATLENAQADLLARVRAAENRVPLVAANKCGVEREAVLYCGKSQIVDAQGALLACAAQDRDETLTARVELGALEPPARVAIERHAISPPDRPLRIGFALEPDERLHEVARWCDVDLVVASAAEVVTEVAAGIARVDDRIIADPASLSILRRDGARCVVWRREATQRLGALSAETLARARAIENRIYVLLEEDGRMTAIDPDGAIVARTGVLRLAQFVLDPARTATQLAPGTDVLDGLAAVDAILAADRSIS